jgi:UDP-N-acetylglucosamine 2-epimerase (hydrolysing)
MLANTVPSFSNHVRQVKPDLIVVHGDRVEPLAGAIVGVLNNVKVAHIEGGEVTGTADEFMRHAISKLSSLHFVSNNEAKLRLIQLGEREKAVIVFGSPDIDIMLSDGLPKLANVKQDYGIDFDDYAIFSYHPVTTSDSLGNEIGQAADAIEKSGRNYIIIYPNNDNGSKLIRDRLDELGDNTRFKCFVSLPFEDFVVLLKNAEYIIGNSSAGVREACVYGVPAIDIGTRQNGRYDPAILRNIQHTSEICDEILDCIERVNNYRFTSYYYGNGHSAEIFMKTIKQPAMLHTEIQKTFVDMSETQSAIRNYINEVSF